MPFPPLGNEFLHLLRHGQCSTLAAQHHLHLLGRLMHQWHMSWWPGKVAMVFLWIGACTVGRFIIIYCSLLKVVCCASPYSKLCPFLSNLMKAEVIDANPGMNLQIYETFPKKLFNSFTVIGGLIVAIAVALAESTSIPLL